MNRLLICILLRIVVHLKVSIGV